MPRVNPNRVNKRNERIKRMWKDGYLMREIADEFNITRGRVSQILGAPMSKRSKKLSTDS